MGLRVTATGNAGVLLENAAGRVFIDSFFLEPSGIGGRPALSGVKIGNADLILATHAHLDHMSPRETLAALQVSGAVFAGPAEAVRLLAGRLPPERLIPLEPPERKKPPASVAKRIGAITVTAFRTYHGRGHNSYLLDMGGCRIYDDADSENTQPYDPAALGDIDLLLLCPWAGSGAGRFVDRLKPRRWLLIHLTDEETAQHRNGAFLPALVDPVPEGVEALYGGETMEIP